MNRRSLSCGLLLLGCLSAAGQSLRIVHIDVEQGGATLFVSPTQHSMLVDSGKNGHGARIKAILQQYGLARIDVFVVTHYHEDHYGGIDELAQDASIVIGTAYDRGDKAFLSSSKRNETRFREYEAAIGHRAIHLTRGMTVPLDPELSVICISSGGAVLQENPPQPGHDENDMSISLLVQFGGFSYFIGGDIEAATEQKIASLDQVQDVDVYQANHHGSDTSSSADFLRDLQPSVVIISNGSNRTYKHPRRATLNSMATLVPTPSIFQTNRYLGTEVEAGNVPTPFIADPEATDADGNIELSVARGASTFRIQFGGQDRQFPIKRVATPALNVVIASLLPNPVGNDRELEEVTLRNHGALQLDLSGWRLQDTDGRIWSLVSMGSLAPGESKAIRRQGMPMSLNNDADEIRLFDDQDVVRDRVVYTGQGEGVRVVRTP